MKKEIPQEQHAKAIPTGLTKREYFAAKALEGLLSFRETSAAIGAGKINASAVAEAAVEYADALIAALNKPAETGGVK